MSDNLREYYETVFFPFEHRVPFESLLALAFGTCLVHLNASPKLQNRLCSTTAK